MVQSQARSSASGLRCRMYSYTLLGTWVCRERSATYPEGHASSRGSNSRNGSVRQKRAFVRFPNLVLPFNGIYRVLFLWGGPAEEDILQHADESGRHRAAIAFYFGGLGTDRRAILARLARERAQSLLVVDELLLLYLCSVTDSRVPILFPVRYLLPMSSRTLPQEVWSP